MESGLLKSMLERSKEDEDYCDNSEDVGISVESFWKSIKIYVEKIHVVNRKVCGVQLETATFSRTSQFDQHSTISTIKNALTKNDTLPKFEKIDSLLNIFKILKFETFQDVCGIFSSSWSVCMIIRTILPKNIQTDSLLEIIILDKLKNNAIFIPEYFFPKNKILPQCIYSFRLSRMKIFIDIIDGNNYSNQWLRHCLLSRLNKWALQSEKKELSTTSSLELIDIQQYNEVYQHLKQKYVQKLMSIWTESTDPLKFIHEDLAIAAYLIVLWEAERRNNYSGSKQSFLDLGCGNGLLVYILISEGYTGVGIDLKKRKIWDTYPSNVILKEESIEPTDKKLFPQYDWIIGNHSDELTPWIPVISSKSSFFQRFFIIPCCAFDFFSKFKRVKSHTSQYSEYLDFIEDLGNKCGFKILKDKLRIPSTKRVCFIGKERNYSIKEWQSQVSSIDHFIKERYSLLKTSNFTNKVLEEPVFVVKEKVQKVKNCTQIHPHLKLELVNKVAALLLSEDNSKIMIEGSSLSWRKGGKVSLKSIAEYFSTQDLQLLKNECGGLQTLLRNHRNIFVVNKGEVHLRIPQPAIERKISAELLRTKECWFQTYHPDGCLLSASDCTYKHIK